MSQEANYDLMRRQVQMDNIKASVIMPAYNAEKYIRKAIDSVLSQTYENWELIVVDDGSKDSTPAIVDDYASKDKRIVVIHQKNSGTASAARNTALKWVTGDYIQMLDSDDMLSSDCLEKYADLIAREQRTGGCIYLPLVYQIDENDNIHNEITYNSRYLGQEINGEDAFKLSVNWSIAGFFFIDSEQLKNIGFDEKIINGDELTTRKLFYGADKVIFTEGKYLYRKNSESTTRSPHNMARMIESLITDENLYNFSVQQSMKTELQYLCLNKWAKDNFAYMAKYEREKKSYSSDDKKKSAQIIKKSFLDISKIRTKDNRGFFWKLTWFCKGDIRRFVRISGIYQNMWKIRERLVRHHDR